MIDFPASTKPVVHTIDSFSGVPFSFISTLEPIDFIINEENCEAIPFKHSKVWKVAEIMERSFLVGNHEECGGHRTCQSYKNQLVRSFVQKQGFDP